MDNIEMYETGVIRHLEEIEQPTIEDVVMAVNTLNANDSGCAYVFETHNRYYFKYTYDFGHPCISEIIMVIVKVDRKMKRTCLYEQPLYKRPYLS